MTSVAEILAAIVPADDGLACTIPPNWMQGRTAFGGLSAALALDAALRLEPDLPPLRSAQIAFIGPLAGTVQARATRLRRGRNAAFLQTDLHAEAGLGLRATFIFMSALESSARLSTAMPAPVPPPAADAQLYRTPDPTFFTHNFEFFDPRAETSSAEWLRWGRLVERTGLHPMIELLLMGDALPPRGLSSGRIAQGAGQFAQLAAQPADRNAHDR